MIDSSSVRVHQHAATAKSGWRRWQHGMLARRPDKQNSHARRWPDRRPIGPSLTPGQTHNGLPAESMLTDLKADAALFADNGYDTHALRALAASKKAWVNIPRNAREWTPSPLTPGLIGSETMSSVSSPSPSSCATRNNMNQLNFHATIRPVAGLIWIKVLSGYCLNHSTDQGFNPCYGLSRRAANQRQQMSQLSRIAQWPDSSNHAHRETLDLAHVRGQDPNRSRWLSE